MTSISQADFDIHLPRQILIVKKQETTFHDFLLSLSYVLSYILSYALSSVHPDTIFIYLISIWGCRTAVKMSLKLSCFRLKIILLSINFLPTGIHISEVSVIDIVQIIYISVNIGEPSALAITFRIEMIPPVLSLPGKLCPLCCRIRSVCILIPPALAVSLPLRRAADRRAS